MLQQHIPVCFPGGLCQPGLAAAEPFGLGHELSVVQDGPCLLLGNSADILLASTFASQDFPENRGLSPSSWFSARARSRWRRGIGTAEFGKTRCQTAPPDLGTVLETQPEASGYFLNAGRRHTEGTQRSVKDSSAAP